MKRWICAECGHVHPGINPPMICPDCGADQDSMKYRKLRKEDYAKIRLTKKRMPDRADVLVLGTGVSAFTAAVTASYYGASVIMMEAGDAIGGGNSTGFSDKEKAAAYKSSTAWEASDKKAVDADSEYKEKASDMLEFLAEEELLPELSKREWDPKGAPHPWQAFAESTLLEDGVSQPPQTKQTLLHQLAHWATDNGVRMLINHEILGFDTDKDGKVTGVNVLFNEKERTYHADLGIISLLGDQNQAMADELEGEPKADELEGLHAIDYVPNVPLNKTEEDYWGKEAIIGPAMTRSYEAGMDIVRSSGLMEELEKILLDEQKELEKKRKEEEAEAEKKAKK